MALMVGGGVLEPPVDALLVDEEGPGSGVCSPVLGVGVVGAV